MATVMIISHHRTSLVMIIETTNTMEMAIPMVMICIRSEKWAGDGNDNDNSDGRNSGND